MCSALRVAGRLWGWSRRCSSRRGGSSGGCVEFWLNDWFLSLDDCDSPPRTTRIGSLHSPSDSPYFVTISSIFPDFTALLYGSQFPLASFSCSNHCSNHCSHHGRFPSLWLGLFRLFHVPLVVSHVLTCAPPPAARDASSLFPFLHSLILCAAGV